MSVITRDKIYICRMQCYGHLSPLSPFLFACILSANRLARWPPCVVRQVHQESDVWVGRR